MALPEKTGPSTDASKKRTLGKGVFLLCVGCAATLRRDELAQTFGVCPQCNHHHKISTDRWLALVCDDGVLEPWAADIRPTDPLSFVDDKAYTERIATSQRRTGAHDAVMVGEASLDGRRVALGAFLFAFMGGSMGSVVGEKITRLFEQAQVRRLPVVLLQASGGARMQEGILSLMQMAKCVAALQRLREANLPFISCLLHPTTGGVAASFAFLGDVNVAEHGALIGFAGPRVIENTIRQTLPLGFQRAEFLLEHGMVDLVCSRLDMKAAVSRLLGHLLDRRDA